MMSASKWSSPRTEVIENISNLLDGDQDAVLATIIDVEGSAYRRPGAKMIINEQGNGIGSITAGCLEDKVRQLAGEVLDDGHLRVETYNLMEGDDDVWGLGVGCNGIIDVLLEPIDERYRPVVKAFEAGEDIIVFTVLESEREDTAGGDRAYYQPGKGFPSTGKLSAAVLNPFTGIAENLARDGKAETVTVETDNGPVIVFIDSIVTPPELLVVGSGHDVGPVVELAKRNDFRVSVVGFRGGADLEKRFLEADVTTTTSPANLREDHEFDTDTYTVVMTHNFVDDRLAVDELLETPVPYIGLMGPRERFEEMRDAFADEGRTFSEKELDRLYTPIGLDRGGGSPHQIATSIVAEALATHNNRQPQHLKEREGLIHDRIDVSKPTPDD